MSLISDRPTVPPKRLLMGELLALEQIGNDNVEATAKVREFRKDDGVRRLTAIKVHLLNSIF